MIQSLSIVVPNQGCINKCAFCVSRMRKDEYPNLIDQNNPLFDLYLKDYRKRLEYAKENGVQTVMLTGSTEPQQNRSFLMFFGLLMQMMDSPFRNIEIQTTGAMLDRNYLRFLRNHVGVNTISLSVSCLDDDDTNNGIIHTPKKFRINLKELCHDIKDYGFNLRLSVNMSKKVLTTCHLDQKNIMSTCMGLGADQITIRKLYADGNTPQADWVRENAVEEGFIDEFIEFAKIYGKLLGYLPWGQPRYDLWGISTVIDTDCMSTEIKEDAKYWILRPDCRLYSKWDSKASLVF